MSQTINSILVSTDGSDGARIGARRGINLAATIGADLHVLSAVDARDIEPDLNADRQTERERLLETEAERAVDSIARLARAHLSGHITTAVESGIPFQAINDYVDARDIDLIVMGTQGRTGFERVVLGSVAEKTLRTADVPIVTVTPDGDIVEIGDHLYENILLPTDGSEGAELAVEWGITLAEVFDATIHTSILSTRVDSAALRGQQRFTTRLSKPARRHSRRSMSVPETQTSVSQATSQAARLHARFSPTARNTISTSSRWEHTAAPASRDT
ncbi:hypothetical protein GCM10009006_11100 [Haloarcula argentinensis]|uniref:UspA domain-containing protein n=1 Tax=Haloarcula argentinensis TaxID=43776 RepID=A0A830FBT0_HALAR|nr:hypothetical protein GCM10009006_11100 [Haloarcula argentinensis]